MERIDDLTKKFRKLETLLFSTEFIKPQTTFCDVSQSHQLSRSEFGRVIISAFLRKSYSADAQRFWRDFPNNRFIIGYFAFVAHAVEGADSTNAEPLFSAALGHQRNVFCFFRSNASCNEVDHHKRLFWKQRSEGDHVLFFGQLLSN